MKITVEASTCDGYQMPQEQALLFSGRAAGICYLPDTYEALKKEDTSKTKKRIDGNIASGHHSVCGHVTYNLVFENVPKILEILLNNEKVYNTSEKSARYTEFKTEGIEKELYEKWIKKFSTAILAEYLDLDKKKVKKLAQENARYVISVFTPSSTMMYTVNFQQLNYLMYFAKEYIKSAEESVFATRLKIVLKDFLNCMASLKLSVQGLDPSAKGRKFSIFATRKRTEEFGENYSINYLASFAQLAQAQRHRTLSYEMSFQDKPSFYVPPIIKGTELEKEWLKDMESIAYNFPQGMQVMVNERGTVENFILKCTERLCGAAQLEIAMQTKATLNKYIHKISLTSPLYNYLQSYNRGAKCTFKGGKCTSPCVFGAKYALNRKI